MKHTIASWLGALAVCGLVAQEVQAGSPANVKPAIKRNTAGPVVHASPEMATEYAPEMAVESSGPVFADGTPYNGPLPEGGEIAYSNPNPWGNYYVGPGNGGYTAEMYPSPRPVPAHVGHTYITYPPFDPHQYLEPHTNRYYANGRHTTVRYRHMGGHAINIDPAFSNVLRHRGVTNYWDNWRNRP